MKSALTISAILAVLVTAPLLQGESVPFRLSLPTENRKLSSPKEFYMYTIRNFEGKTTYPWRGGAYGFTRNAVRTGDGIVMTKFHEGIDIQPMRRDSSNRPLDLVKPLAAGTVRHVNPTSSHSSYGKYVVVEHPFPEGPLYSLYAHLADTRVKPGEWVNPSVALGRLGYTGRGLNRTRAHVHVELNMLLSSQFQAWHKRHFNSPNYHGIYNGLNLAGLNVGQLLEDSLHGITLSLPTILAQLETYYRVAVPSQGLPDLLTRYPFLCPKPPANAAAWEFHLSRSGLPLRIQPLRDPVSQARVTWVRSSSTPHAYHTRGRLTGQGSTAGLTSSGKRYIELLHTSRSYETAR